MRPGAAGPPRDDMMFLAWVYARDCWQYMPVHATCRAATPTKLRRIPCVVEKSAPDLSARRRALAPGVVEYGRRCFKVAGVIAAARRIIDRV